MSPIVHKLRKYYRVIRYLPNIIYLNLKLLPFRQAVRLPIFIYKPKFGQLSGGVILDMPKDEIKPGIIRLGEPQVNLYPNTGCMIDLRGTIKFRGMCNIGNNSFISVGESGEIEFGKDFVCYSSLKMACYSSIKFGDHVLVGWDCLFIDSDFHALTLPDGSKAKGYSPIVVGNEVWFGTGCKVLKRTIVPNQCVVAANTVLASKIEAPERSVIGNNDTICIKGQGLYRDYNNDKILYFD